jgi:2-keto-3-deoxy-6-phosphogluconate aldolase
VAGVGIGGKLVTKEILQTKNYDLLKEKTKEVISIIEKLGK